MSTMPMSAPAETARGGAQAAVGDRRIPVPELRLLERNEAGLLESHLLALDKQARHDRFNGGMTDDGIRAYVARTFKHNAIVVGAFVDGKLAGCGELHAENLAPGEGEVALSVLEPWTGRGVGRLIFGALLGEAFKHDLETLLVTTHASNDPMRALARHYGAEMVFTHGEGAGRIAMKKLRIPAIVLPRD